MRRVIVAFLAVLLGATAASAERSIVTVTVGVSLPVSDTHVAEAQILDEDSLFVFVDTLVGPRHYIAHPVYASDFDTSGTVMLEDFFLFVDAFGSDSLKYDINRNGTVEFGDFFKFADQYGKSALGIAKPTAYADEESFLSAVRVHGGNRFERFRHENPETAEQMLARLAKKAVRSTSDAFSAPQYAIDELELEVYNALGQKVPLWRFSAGSVSHGPFFGTLQKPDGSHVSGQNGKPGIQFSGMRDVGVIKTHIYAGLYRTQHPAHAPHAVFKAAGSDLLYYIRISSTSDAFLPVSSSYSGSAGGIPSILTNSMLGIDTAPTANDVGTVNVTGDATGIGSSELFASDDELTLSLIETTGTGYTAEIVDNQLVITPTDPTIGQSATITVVGVDAAGQRDTVSVDIYWPAVTRRLSAALPDTVMVGEYAAVSFGVVTYYDDVAVDTLLIAADSVSASAPIAPEGMLVEAVGDNAFSFEYQGLSTVSTVFGRSTAVQELTLVLPDVIKVGRDFTVTPILVTTDHGVVTARDTVTLDGGNTVSAYGDVGSYERVFTYGALRDTVSFSVVHWVQTSARFTRYTNSNASGSSVDIRIDVRGSRHVNSAAELIGSTDAKSDSNSSADLISYLEPTHRWNTIAYVPTPNKETRVVTWSVQVIGSDVEGLTDTTVVEFTQDAFDPATAPPTPVDSGGDSGGGNDPQPSPQASLNSLSGPSTLSQGQSGTFTASASNATRIEWIVDGSPTGATGSSYSFSSTSVGNHTVTARAVNDSGSDTKTAEKSVTVFVGGGAP